MLTGLPPFYDEDTTEMYKKILEDPLRFPADIDRDARALLTRLLDREPTKRLGANGAAEIKSHRFFDTIDWRRLLQKKIQPTFRPNVVCMIRLNTVVLLTIVVERYGYRKLRPGVYPRATNGFCCRRLLERVCPAAIYWMELQQTRAAGLDGTRQRP
jgi:serine/threonine protein kinase